VATAGAIVAVAVSAAAPSLAGSGTGRTQIVNTPVGRIGGLVFSRPSSTSELAPHGAWLHGSPFARFRFGTADLAYHGGPVMRTNRTYAIYWIPGGYSVSPSYVDLIDRFFADVAADSGKSTNVYATDTQYSDGTGPIAYDSTFGGSVVDANAFPANGCSISGITRCLTDGQIVSEINRVASAQGWTENGTTQFFMFTPKDVGTCFSSGARSSSNPCSFTDFCAYHGSSGSLIYADQPYTVSTKYPNSCDVHQYPNGDDADPTINVTSHEHNEAITDPELDAWYDRNGYENGDKCAWKFGAASGSSGAQYNQTINGHHYLLQEEYSNDGHACLLS
jgi:hypothetical protein